MGGGAGAVGMGWGMRWGGRVEKRAYQVKGTEAWKGGVIIKNDMGKLIVVQWQGLLLEDFGICSKVMGEFPGLSLI